MPLFYKGKDHEAYLSHVKVQITTSRKDIYLILVYGITEHPMMLAINKEIKSNEDVIKIAKLYFSRWRIEEYFRCKKQMFQFESFSVRKLKAINAYAKIELSFLLFGKSFPASLVSIHMDWRKSYQFFSLYLYT